MAIELKPDCTPHPAPRGLLLLDIDDVLCLSQPFAVYHARAALWRAADEPANIWETLFNPKSVAALGELMQVCRPQVVITSSWLGVLDRQHFAEVFQRTGLAVVADALHKNWKAAPSPEGSRHEAISRWLEDNHRGEPLLILDDVMSGEGLIDSEWHAAGHQILCEIDRGFHSGLLPTAIQALRTPYLKPEWW